MKDYLCLRGVIGGHENKVIFERGEIYQGLRLETFQVDDEILKVDKVRFFKKDGTSWIFSNRKSIGKLPNFILVEDIYLEEVLEFIKRN